MISKDLVPQGEMNHFNRFFLAQKGSPRTPSSIVPLLLLLGFCQPQYFIEPFRVHFNSKWPKINQGKRKCLRDLCSDTDASKGLQKAPGNHHKGGGNHMAKNSKEQVEEKKEQCLISVMDTRRHRT